MPNSNTVLKRFEAGGILTISDGTTTLTILRIKAGSLKFDPGFYDPIEYKDRGVIMVPLEGDEMPGDVEFEVFFSGGADASDVIKHLMQRDTTNYLMKEYTIVAKFPNNKGAAAGHQVTFAHCILPQGGIGYQSGEKLDSVKAKMRHNEAQPTWATY